MRLLNIKCKHLARFLSLCAIVTLAYPAMAGKKTLPRGFAVEKDSIIGTISVLDWREASVDKSKVDWNAKFVLRDLGDTIFVSAVPHRTSRYRRPNSCTVSDPKDLIRLRSADYETRIEVTVKKGKCSKLKVQKDSAIRPAVPARPFEEK